MSCPDPARPELPPLAVDAREAARLLGVGRSTWVRLTSAGKTPRPFRLGRRTLWNVDELRAWRDAGAPARERWDAIRAREAGR